MRVWQVTVKSITVLNDQFQLVCHSCNTFFCSRQYSE